MRPLKIFDKDPLEVRPVMDAVVLEEFEPCSNMFPYVDGEILNDEVVVIHPSGSVGEPYTGLRLPSVLGDIGGRSEAWWEQRSSDTPVEGPWSWAIRAGTPVV